MWGQIVVRVSEIVQIYVSADDLKIELMGSLIPSHHPAFCHLHYRKAIEGLEWSVMWEM